MNNLSPHVEKLLRERYFLRDKNGNLLETDIDAMFTRVARAIARAEKNDSQSWADKFYLLMKDKKFLPNTPTLINAGKPKPGCFSACFVLPVEDSMIGIFDAVKQSALIMKCLPEDATILTKDGPKQIRNIHAGDIVYDRDGIEREVESKNNAGIKPVYSIKLNKFSIEATLEHKFLSIDNTYRFYSTKKSEAEFKEIGLSKDRKPLLAKLPEINGATQEIEWSYSYKANISKGHFAPKPPLIPKYLSFGLSWLLGYFSGDGSFSEDGIRFTINDRDYHNITTEICYILEENFAVIPHIYGSNTTRASIEVPNIQVKEFFQFLFGHNKQSIPRIIFKEIKELRWAFLSGLIDSDGCVFESGHIYISTSNKIFKDEIICLFNTLGCYAGFNGFLPNISNNIGYQIRPITKASYEKCIANLSLFHRTKAGRLTKVFLKDSGIGTFEDFKFISVDNYKFIGDKQCYNLTIKDVHEYNYFQLVSKNSGGGVGYNFGHLREKGAIVKSTGHKASGPVSFMKAFDAMIDTVAQGGTRRGAAIAVLPIDHPDIEEFIEMKDGGGFSNFNISVGITDAFMKAVEEDGYWYLFSPLCDEDKVLPSGAIMVSYPHAIVIKARRLWDKIVEHAWKTGDPGLLFLDTINKAHPLDEEIEASNPCGEIPLRPYESCNLGSINLMAYINKPCSITDSRESGVYSFDWDALEKDIPTMVRFLDDVIDVNPFPLPEIDKASKESRKIGLGIMGWADVLLKMKIPYDSQEALDLAEELMKFIQNRACDASEQLAKEKGRFPLQDEEECPRRNATLLTVAPTGTLSRIAGVSSGIEPTFSWNTHHKLVDLEYDETHWMMEQWKKENSKIGDKVYPFPAYMKTANEIHFNWHLAMQASFQKYVDNSISKTINLPTDATVDDVYDIYLQAWKLGLKGITVYRNNSRKNQPMSKIEPYKVDFLERPKEEQKAIIEQPSLDEILNKRILRKRGPVAVGVTHKVDTGRGKIYITINYSEYHSEPVEVFIRLGHLATPTESALAEWSGRLISLLLKYNVPLESVMRQSNKVYADTIFWYNQQSFCSLPKLISHLLEFTFEEAMDKAGMDFESMLENGDDCYEEDLPYEPVPHDAKRLQNLAEGATFCYQCGEYVMMHREGNCLVCSNCGDSKCG